MLIIIMLNVESTAPIVSVLIQHMASVQLKELM